MKKWICVILSLCLLASCSAVFGACGGRGDEIIVWWVSGRENERIIRESIAAFKRDNPDAGEIKIVLKPGMDIFNAYKIALDDEKTRPDVAVLDHVYVQSLAYDGLIADLDACGAGAIRDRYPEGLYAANLYAGKAYALPLSANTIALMYNRDILRAAGVTDDGTATGTVTPPTTLDELYAACAKVKAIGKTPFAQPINRFAAMTFMSYVGRLGGRIVSDDYRSITITDPKVEAALEKWKIFADEGYVNTNEFEEAKFYTGQVAFVEMGSWNISKVTGASSFFDCGFSEMVTIDPQLPNYSGLGLYSLVVAQASAQKETAYKIAEFLSTDLQTQLDFNRTQNLFPVTVEALADPYYTGNPILATYAAQLETVIARPGTPVWPDLEQALVTMLRSAVLNGSVTDALQKAQRDAQAATDRLFR